MKESITKFDLEAAFKALDDIDIPVAGKVKANRPALTEIFSKKSKFDSLVEEYYDVSSSAELEDAKEAREAEVAKAKLARIEKIVDLDADSPEDLLTSYVGKYIMQCPQCMTLFYKDSEDVVKDEEDPSIVNVNEICQHCGNEAGYTLIGKVGEAELGEFEEPAPAEEEIPVEEASVEEQEEVPAEDDLSDLEDINLDLNLKDEEEKKEESFTNHDGGTLMEELVDDDKELTDKLEAHNEYIEYLRGAIVQEEEKLEKATNEQVKVSIQRNIDAFKADLEAALPEAVKNGEAMAEEPVVETSTEEVPNEEEPKVQEESCDIASEGEALTEALHEEKNLDVSEEEFKELIDSPEFNRPISDTAVRAMINAEKEVEENKEVKEAAKELKVGEGESLKETLANLEEVQELVLETLISSSLVEAYGNVAGFRLTECAYIDNKFTVGGTIYFTSGNTRKTTYKFNESYKTEDDKINLIGLNEKLGLDRQFILTGSIDNKTLITESFKCNK